MVVYHAINYSVFRPLAFRYLAFLPPSFILITGFLVGQVYADKYDLQTWKPYGRLAVRGTKLLLMFTLLNLGHCFILEHSFLDGMDEFAARSKMLFLSGNGHAGIFVVLLPIAYFLLLAPLLLWCRFWNKASIAICAVAVFFICLILERHGRFFNNLALLSAGIIGMAFGLMRIELIDRLAGKWLPILLIYLVYRLFSYKFGESYAVQTFAAVASVLLLYGCALHLDTDTWIGHQMLILGQYSLLGYLTQIAVLQGMVKVFGGTPDHVVGVIAVVVLTTALTFLAVKAVHELRQRSRAAQIIYKSVFA